MNKKNSPHPLNPQWIQRLSDKQNRHIMTLMRTAAMASMALTQKGLTILSVNLEQSMPVITVAPTNATKQLDGFQVRKRIAPGQHTNEYQAVENDCLIKWEKNNVH